MKDDPHEPVTPIAMAEAVTLANHVGEPLALHVRRMANQIDRLTTELATATEETRQLRETRIEVYQHDWMPGFAAFDVGSAERGVPHVALNIGSLLATVETGEVDTADLPYFIAESIMHEAIHALEEWAGVEFDEDRVESLLSRYREHAKGIT